MKTEVISTNSPNAIANALEVLLSGGLVAFPTDTVYGVGALVFDEKAVESIYAAKERPVEKAIPVLIGDAVDLNQVADEIPMPAARLIARFWPGPLTIVVPAADALSRLLAPRGTLGVRVPAHAVARALAQQLGECITATSANRSGAAAPATAADVVRAFSDGVDLLLDGGAAPGGAPSTIVEVVQGRLTMHRAGAIAWDRVLESLE